MISGFSFVRKNSGLNPFILGGSQERGLRAGTESVHNIAGMETAFVHAYKNLEKDRKYVSELKEYCKNIKTKFCTKSPERRTALYNPVFSFFFFFFLISL